MPPETDTLETVTRDLEDTPVLKLRWTLLLILSGVLFLLLLIFARQASTPAQFPIESNITIAPGQSVTEIVTDFEANGYVRSADLLHAVLVLLHDSTQIRAGTYTFSEPAGVFSVAKTITEVGPSDPLVLITFPEGMTAQRYAAVAADKLSDFDENRFLELTSDFEGTLFPDTYYIPPTYTAEELFTLLIKTYQEKVAPLRSAIDNHSLTESQIITLASVIEREANSPDSMRLVSGILQNRLAIDMPLQADAAIEYVLDVPLNKLPPGQLAIELKENDSPYNTYLYTGLPPTPIGNPGLTAIEAVLDPAESDYFYYLTDSEGEFHYARTLNEHNLNVARYLR